MRLRQAGPITSWTYYQNGRDHNDQARSTTRILAGPWKEPHTSDRELCVAPCPLHRTSDGAPNWSVRGVHLAPNDTTHGWRSLRSPRSRRA